MHILCKHRVLVLCAQVCELLCATVQVFELCTHRCACNMGVRCVNECARESACGSVHEYRHRAHMLACVGVLSV